MNTPKMLSLIITLLSLIASPLTFAKMINLYEQPKLDAKVLGTIDTEKGMVPIYSPAQGEWMKVGDPKDGNVGWIKTSDLSDKSGSLSTQVSVSEHTVNTPNGPKTYQVVQLSTPKPMSDAEAQAIAKQMQTREQEMQKNVQKMFQDFYKGMNILYQVNSAALPPGSYPMIVPVIVVPKPITLPAPASAPAKSAPAAAPATTNPATTPAKS